MEPKHLPKYGHVHVQLIDKDGNAYSILARVQRALRRAQVPAEERERFIVEATAGDYAHLLDTVARWVHTD